jgi:uncharacterized protein (DUF58 family)
MTRLLIPAGRLVWLAGAVAAASVLAAAVPELFLPWLAFAVLATAAACADGLLARRVALPVAARSLPGSLALGVPHEVVLRLRNPGDRAVTAEIYDHHPGEFATEGLPQTVTLAPATWVQVRYRLHPASRGDFRFGRTEARIASPFGLWRSRGFLGEEATLRVYPNFRALAHYTLLATDNRLSQIGVLQQRRRGEGMDFHQLREYRLGDSLRAIDWKATARFSKPISREYQDERDQRIMLLLDCGRRMAARDDALSHFDHALDAALLLAHVALRQGDAVGVMTMGGEKRYLAPRKSVSAVNVILNRVYDLQPTLRSPDYYEAALEVMRRNSRRTLVVILSNLRDEDDDTLRPALALLRERHLVVFASLQEAILGRALTTRVSSFDRALTHAAAAEYLIARERSFRRYAAEGAVMLDVEPRKLAMSLVNRYLHLKRSGRL